MKNVLFYTASAAALAMATPAAAQSLQNSDVLQNGDDNMAVVSQTGNEGMSDIDQNGDDNLAEVTQTENPNAGSNSFNVPANEAIINQIGDNSRARITQNSDNPGSNPGNSATINQESEAPAGNQVPSGYA